MLTREIKKRKDITKEIKKIRKDLAKYPMEYSKPLHIKGIECEIRRERFLTWIGYIKIPRYHRELIDDTCTQIDSDDDGSEYIDVHGDITIGTIYERFLDTVIGFETNHDDDITLRDMTDENVKFMSDDEMKKRISEMSPYATYKDYAWTINELRRFVDNYLKFIQRCETEYNRRNIFDISIEIARLKKQD